LFPLGNIYEREQLKGKDRRRKPFGNNIGHDSPSRFCARLGVDPEKETKIIATGENPQRLAALANNLTQFTLLGGTARERSEKLGFRDLYANRHAENSLPRPTP